MFILSLTHLLFAPPLLYIGLNRSATPHWAFQALLVAGAIVFLYHASRLYTGSYINIIHVCLIAPLFKRQDDLPWLLSPKTPCACYTSA